MSEWLALAPTLIAGSALGIVFFGGLWWTVRHCLSSRRVALCFFASLLLRTGIVLGGLYLACGSDWRRWLAALLGFFFTRLAVTYVTRQLPPLAEDGHAP